jgi:methionine-R-sulfoxide reductase
MTEDEWKKKLTPEQYHILREKGTETAFSGKYAEFDEDGIYVCAGCGNPLFASEHKFDCGCGWPSFDEALPNHVKFRPDRSYGLSRTEVVCARCESHLGHVFKDGPTPSGERFCINSLAMDFEPQENN